MSDITPDPKHFAAWLRDNGGRHAESAANIIDNLRAEIERLRAERDALHAEVSRLATTLATVQGVTEEAIRMVKVLRDGGEG